MQTAGTKKRSAKAAHTNRKAIYAKVVRDIRSRSSKEVFETLIEAGIYQRNGRLTKHYRAA